MAHGTDMAGYRRGCLNFVRDFHRILGVEFDGRRPGFALHESTGLAHKPANTARAEEVELRPLAEAIMGHDFVEEYYHPNNGFDFSNRLLLEAAIDPTAFLQTSVFNLSVAGLVNAEIIERFTAPEYIGRNLVAVKPTSMNGQKLIGTNKLSPVNKASKGRMPGQAHPEIQFSDQYKVTPETVEQALKCRVTKEAVFFNLTGQVLETAGEVGDELAYGMEKDIADGILGKTGISGRYNLNGTTIETYQTASPFINDHENPFANINDVDEARLLFVGMTDPMTGREISINSYNILCFPHRELRIREQLFAPNFQVGSENTAANFPGRWAMTPNQINTVGRGTYTLTPLSAIWFNRATASDGLNLSASNAREYWYIGDFQKAFRWYENWPLTPWQASADELVMKDEGIVAVYGANYRGEFFVNEPRYVVRNKAAS